MKNLKDDKKHVLLKDHATLILNLNQQTIITVTVLQQICGILIHV